MTQDALKQKVALAALQYVPPGEILGVGTGSTVNFFIDALATQRSSIPAVVASSERSAARLRQHAIRVVDLNDVESLSVYVDGADEINTELAMIKGGGGALTREKIVAAVAKKFVCIVDASKRVPMLGRFPLAVEVIPMARTYAMRELRKLGGEPKLRNGFTTDNGNIIIDVAGLVIAAPLALEERINNIVGVVASGLFARRGADVLLLGDASGVQTFTR